MNRKINTIKIFCNDNAKSKKIKKIIIDKLTINNYSIVEENPDLCLAIGGDGSFLRMSKTIILKVNHFMLE